MWSPSFKFYKKQQMNYVNAALHDQFCLVYPKVWGKKKPSTTKKCHDYECFVQESLKLKAEAKSA